MPLDRMRFLARIGRRVLAREFCQVERERKLERVAAVIQEALLAHLPGNDGTLPTWRFFPC